MSMEKEKVAEFLKPFGPLILKIKISDNILNDLNQNCLDISNN